MNKLGRGPLGDATGSRLHVFPIQYVTPRGGGGGGGQVLYLNKLGRGPLGVTKYTKYQCSRPCSFRQEDFSCLSYISLCKTLDSQGGVMFAPRSIFLTNLVEVY